VDARPAGAGEELAIDVAGYYTTAADGEAGRHVSLDPTRINDTRTGGTGPWGTVYPWVQYAEVITGQGGTGAAAVVMNLTVTRPTAAGWITVHPDERCGVIPEASNLNFRAGETVANLVVARLATDDSCQLVPGASYFRNGSPGYVDLLFDVAGYFTA
jgi:hypothetical protein